MLFYMITILINFFCQGFCYLSGALGNRQHVSKVCFDSFLVILCTWDLKFFNNFLIIS